MKRERVLCSESTESQAALVKPWSLPGDPDVLLLDPLPEKPLLTAGWGVPHCADTASVRPFIRTCLPSIPYLYTLLPPSADWRLLEGRGEAAIYLYPLGNSGHVL